MGSIKESLYVTFSTKQMYDLVNEIETYPQFIPGCIEASVIRRQEDSLDAELLLRKGGFSSRLKTRNKLNPYKRIDLELLSGPFSSLHGAWTFIEQNENASIVQLELDFEMKNKLLNFAFKKRFQQISKELIQSFYQRAQKLYA